MTVRVVHTTQSAQPDSADGKISKNAWNEDHTIEGLGTAAAANTSDFAAASHTHAIANITGLQTALDGKQPLQQLTANTTFYVSTTGNDTTGDGSEGAPWATLQHAADVLGATDFNGHDAYIQLIAGSYVGAAFVGLRSSRANLDGFAATITDTTSTLFIQGDPGDPSACVLSTISAAEPAILCITGDPSVNFCIKNFTEDYTDRPSDGAINYCYHTTLFIGDGTGSEIRAIGNTGDLFSIGQGSTCWHLDKVHLTSNFDYGFDIRGNSFLYSYGEIEFAPLAYTGYFVRCLENSLAQFFDGLTFTGSTPPGGHRFAVESGSVIDLSGLTGSTLTTLPGTLAGTVASGGKYVSAAATLSDLSGFATVASTGAYADLTGQPSLAAVATSGSAADLSGTLAAARLPAFAGGDVTSSSGSATLTLGAGAVSLAKMANMATASVIYRKTAGSGAPEVQTLATLKTDLGLTGTNSGDQTITLTGDVTGTGTGSFVTTIGVGTVTRGMMANTSAATVLGSTAAGAVSELTAAQTKTFLALTAADIAAAGSTTQVLFNDGGATAGNAGLIFDKSTQTLTIGRKLLAGDGGASLAAGVPGIAFTGATGVGFRRLSTIGAIFTASGADIWFTAASSIEMRSNGTYGWSSTTDPTAAQDVTLSRVAAGVMKVANGSGANGVIVTAATPTVAGLPAAATVGAGARAFVNDATATTFLSAVAGGGSNKVPVVSDGTNWLIG